MIGSASNKAPKKTIELHSTIKRRKSTGITSWPIGIDLKVSIRYIITNKCPPKPRNIKVDTINRKTQNTVDTTNKILPNSAKMGKFKEFNPTVSTATTKLLGIKNSYEYEKSDWRLDLDEDWQKTNRQDKTDGMSQKAVNAYRRENPGSKLKTAVTQKPSTLKRGSKKAKRRKSFCSRMKGMKKRLTSAKTARDPDSRINKALRRWNC